MLKKTRAELLTLLGPPNNVSRLKAKTTSHSTLILLDRTGRGGSFMAPQGEGEHWTMVWNCGNSAREARDNCQVVSETPSPTLPDQWLVLKLCSKHKDLL